MSIELIVNPDDDGEGEGFDLGPNQAWRDFADWVETVCDETDALYRLAVNGLTGDAARTALELEYVLEPDDIDDGVAAIGERLLELIEDLTDEDVLLISAG